MHKYMPGNVVPHNTRHKTNPKKKKRDFKGKKWTKVTQYCGQWWALVLAMWNLGHPTAIRGNLQACIPKQENLICSNTPTSPFLH